MNMGALFDEVRVPKWFGCNPSDPALYPTPWDFQEAEKGALGVCVKCACQLDYEDWVQFDVYDMEYEEQEAVYLKSTMGGLA